MSRYAGWLVLALLVACIPFALVAADDADDLKLLAGAWKPKEANLGDNLIDPLLLDKTTVVYEGDKYTINIDGKTEKGSFTLDPQKVPKTMDIYPTQGDNNGKTFWAVYEINGDKLTICYSLSPGVRPENFEPDSNTLLTVKYERMK
jgi:uncharacterized protein (TIGR03067 family)